ncbi:MAG: HD domain-containing protein [Chloroflexota bacterium]|jgi:poly(A) polymerase
MVRLFTVLADRFTKAGKELFLVGGSVRDRLLRRPSPDLDFATDATPPETESILAQRWPQGTNLTIYKIGEKFGTIGAIIDGQRIEITTYRGETYQDTRKPDVEFLRSLEEDLARRDFTINAMAMAVDGKIIDPFGGRSDLVGRYLRAVGNPQERFNEDPLRMLRAIRFACQLGFEIERDTYAAIIRKAHMLRTISWERKAEEMNKILLSTRPAEGLKLLYNSYLLDHVIPELLPMIGLQQRGDYHHKDVWRHTLQVVENTPADLTLRWAATLHDIAKPATKTVDGTEVHFFGHEMLGADMARQVLLRLRFSSEFVERVTKLVRMHQRINLYESDWTNGAVRRFVREAGEELPLLFALSKADITSQREAKVAARLALVRELEQRVEQLKAEEEIEKIKSPLDGNELMAIFSRPPGPWIRDVKERLLNAVLDGEIASDDKAGAEAIAREMLAGVDAPPESPVG